MRTALLFLLYFLLLPVAEAQEKITLRGDLKAASPIRINQKYSFQKSPAGFGNLKEFRENSQRSDHLFREERNSAWFLIEAPFNGILTFDLSPHQIKNDYDWMLFDFNADLEKRIASGTASPLRTNNARNAVSLNSKTGMKAGATSNFVKPGPGDK
jgi:hypothetical protein